MPLTERCNLVRTYTSLIGYGAIRLRQAALLAITGIVFCLALASEQGPGIGEGRSAETTSSQKVTQYGFVGSRSCVPCHQKIYDTFVKSRMGRSMTRVTPGLLANLATYGSLYDEKLNQHFEVFARAGKLFQSEYATEVGGKETFRETHEIQWIIGSGSNGFGGLTTNGAYLFQGPLSFYSKVGAWALSPGYEFGNYGFNRPILAGCVTCHSGQAMTAAGGNGRFEDPPFQELAIGCENCHGPGQQHVREMTGKGTGRTAHTSIVNPARLSPALADNICMFCHQTGDVRVLKPNKDYRDFRPGEPLDDTLSIFLVPPKRESPPPSDHVEHYYSMILSKCYRSSKRGLSCTTCHDPHVQPSGTEAPGYFAGKCASCHTDKSCKLPLSVRQQQKPPNDCAGCHMAKRDVGVILHSSVGHSQPENALVQASLGRRALLDDKASEAAVHLRRAVKIGPPQATTYADLAEAQIKLGQENEAILSLEKAVELDPFNAVFQKKLVLRFIEMKQYAQAGAALKQYVQTFPQDSFMRQMLNRANSKEQPK